MGKSRFPTWWPWPLTLSFTHTLDMVHVHHHTKFGDHRSNGSWDMNFFLVTFFLVLDRRTDGQNATHKSPPCIKNEPVSSVANTPFMGPHDVTPVHHRPGSCHPESDVFNIVHPTQHQYPLRRTDRETGLILLSQRNGSTIWIFQRLTHLKWLFFFHHAIMQLSNKTNWHQ